MVTAVLNNSETYFLFCLEWQIILFWSRREGVGVVYHKHAFIKDMHILSSAVGVLYM